MTAEVTAPAALARVLDLVLGAYPVAGAREAPDIEVSVVRDDDDRPLWRVASGDRTYPERANVGFAARRVEWLIISEAVKRWTPLVHVHAGLVATPRQSALLIGRSGSGKSTTTVALGLEGLRVYTDDVALIEPTTMRPLCVPRPIKLDKRSRRMLRLRGLSIPRGRSLGESVDRLVLPGLPDVEEPGPPLTSAIFFAPKRAERPELRPLTSAEAVMRLILQSASEKFEASGPSASAMAIVNAVRCYELVPASLDLTVRTMLDYLATTEP